MILAFAGCAADVWTFEDMSGATKSEKTKFFKQTSAGPDRPVRVLITAEHPRGQMPKPPKQRFPEVCIGVALAKRPILRNIGPTPMPAQEAASFFAETQCRAAAIDPAYIPYQAPKLTSQPWTPHDAQIQGAFDADAPRQKKRGARKRRPPAARLSLASLRSMAAGGIAGPRREFGGMRAQLTSLATAAVAALRTDKETAARLAGDQDKERKQIAQGHRDRDQIASQMSHPNLPIVARVAEEVESGLASRTSGEWRKAESRPKRENQTKKAKGQYGSNMGGRGGYYPGKPDRSRDLDKFRKKRPIGGRGRDRDEPRSVKRRNQEDRSRSRKQREPGHNGGK